MPRQSPTESATQYAPGVSLIGNNDEMWVVRRIKNGIHRWVPADSAISTSPNRTTPRRKKSTTRKSSSHRTAKKTPHSSTRKSTSKEHYNEHYNELYKELRRKHRGDKVYTTHDNGSRPFVVYVSKQHATVYRQHSDIDDSEWSKFDRKNRWAYTQQVVQFPIHKCHVGKSPITPTSRGSNGYGKPFDGNTLLLDRGNGTYAYVGECVYTFSLMPGDTFHSYFSVVGNNDVPYPILRGHTHVYFLLSWDRTAVPLSKWTFAPNTNEPLRTRWADAYGDYYTMKMETHSVPLRNVREIQARLV